MTAYEDALRLQGLRVELDCMVSSVEGPPTPVSKLTMAAASRIVEDCDLLDKIMTLVDGGKVPGLDKMRDLTSALGVPSDAADFYNSMRVALALPSNTTHVGIDPCLSSWQAHQGASPPPQRGRTSTTTRTVVGEVMRSPMAAPISSRWRRRRGRRP